MRGIILVRHGETEWNRVERFRGRMDLELNERGRAQAQASGRALTSVSVAAVYSSPLRRALDTAAAIAVPHGLVVQPCLGLLDIDYGQWQGLTPEEVTQRYPEPCRQWLEQPHQVRIPGGEGLEEVRRRAVAAVDEALAAVPADQWAVMVSHKVICKLLLCHALGLSAAHFWQVEQDICGISRFELKEGRLVVSVTNDTCHLAELE